MNKEIVDISSFSNSKLNESTLLSNRDLGRNLLTKIMQVFNKFPVGDIEINSILAFFILNSVNISMNNSTGTLFGVDMTINPNLDKNIIIFNSSEIRDISDYQYILEITDEKHIIL